MISNLGSGPRISNINLTSSNTEYSFTFGLHVKKFLIQPRNFKDLKIAFVAGETDTNYISLVSGSPYWEDHILGPITVYIKALENNVVAEILEWSSRD